MEVIEIKTGQQLLVGSEITGIGGGVFDSSTPQSGDGTGGAGRAPLFMFI